MRLVVIIVAALMILGLAALGLVLAQRETTSTVTAASTVRVASETQDVSALPTRAPVGRIAEATGLEAPPLILEANLGVQSESLMATVTQAPFAAATASNVKDQNRSTIAKALVHEATRLKDDATGWAHKLLELELDLNLQLDFKKNQDSEAAGKDINECLVVLRAAAGRLVPDAETRVTLREQEDAVRNLAIRAEVHPDPDIRNTAGYFQQKATELHALNRSVEEIRTRLVTQIDRLEELKIQLEFNRTAVQIGEAVKGGAVSLDDMQAITAEVQRIAADLDGFGTASAVVTEPTEAANAVEVKTSIPGNPNERPRSRIRKRLGHLGFVQETKGSVGLVTRPDIAPRSSTTRR
jgi:hypothetical protein